MMKKGTDLGYVFKVDVIGLVIGLAIPGKGKSGLGTKQQDL